MPNIGTTRGDIAYLVDVLVEIAHDLADRLSVESSGGLSRHISRVDDLVEGPPLPNFSRFHSAFKPDSLPTPEGDLRRAYFLAYEDSNISLVALNAKLLEAIKSGREYVSAAFVTPYPPGFPVLVPGQIISREIIEYLLELDVKEIHGYDPEKGLRVFSEHVLVEKVEQSATSHNIERM
jgi:arginine decarboxylase